MADDIVTSLRTVDEFSDAIGIMDDAAHEIERLRAAGDAIAAVLACLCGDRQDVCRLLDAWEEARRG